MCVTHCININCDNIDSFTPFKPIAQFRILKEITANVPITFILRAFIAMVSNHVIKYIVNDVKYNDIQMFN